MPERMYPCFTIAISFLVGPVHMDFPFPTAEPSRRIVLVDPKGHEILARRGAITCVSPAYKDRVKGLTFGRQTIQFALEDEERSLAGRFSCRYDTATGPTVLDCGETLLYLELTQPQIMGRNTAIEGGEVQLICMSDTVSLYNDLGLTFMYTWFKDATMVARQKEELLTLEGATSLDEGDYSCRVAETSKMCSPSAQSSPLRLVLLKPPKVHIEPNAAENLLERRVPDNLTLTCVVDSAMPAVPRDGYSWTFSPSDSSPARQLTLTGATLTLGPVTREDSGQYTCQARNDQKLKDQVLRGNASVQLQVTYLEGLSLTSDVEVREGHSFTLTCSVDSSPTALLQWRLDGVVKRGVRANVDRFVVMATTIRDSGHYTCTASNGEFPSLQAMTTVTCVDCSTEKRKIKSPASPNPGVGVGPRLTQRLRDSRPLTPDIIALIAASVSVLIVVVIVVAILLRSLRCQVSARPPEPRPVEQRISLLLVDAS